MPKKLFLTVIIVEVLIGALALAFIISAYWHMPLGPRLAVANQFDTLEKNAPVPAMIELQATPAAPEPAPTHATLLSHITSLLNRPAKTSQPLCGGPSVMTILLVGSDERDQDYLYGLADSIRVVRIDFTTPRVMLLDFPRDLWVDIPGIADHYGIRQGKLNQAYFFGNPGMGYYDGPGEGPGLLAQTLEQNYGLQVDHYLAVNRSSFVEMIDTIGGIDIQLSSEIDLNEGQDGANPDLVLGAGSQHLDGAMALRFASNRFPTIFQRARFQNIVLLALQEKLLDLAMLPELPQLVSQFAGAVQTDLSPSDINQLICLSRSLTRDNTQFVAFPDEMFIPGKTYDPYRQVYTYTLSVDMRLFREYINAFMDGLWPDDSNPSN